MDSSEFSKCALLWASEEGMGSGKHTQATVCCFSPPPIRLQGSSISSSGSHTYSVRTWSVSRCLFGNYHGNNTQYTLISVLQDNTISDKSYIHPITEPSKAVGSLCLEELEEKLLLPWWYSKVQRTKRSNEMTRSKEGMFTGMRSWKKKWKCRRKAEI